MSLHHLSSAAALVFATIAATLDVVTSTHAATNFMAVTDAGPTMPKIVIMCLSSPVITLPCLLKIYVDVRA